MRMSAKGLAFLSNEEGLRTAPYNDSAGHATVGVGHLLHRGRVTAADRASFRGFTRADAVRLLRRDAASRERAVSRLVHVPVNQNEFDALVSLVFNIGEGSRGFGGSTVLRKLNSGDRRGAADAFLMWRIGGPGLIFRRRRERALFLSRAGNTALNALSPIERHNSERLLWHRRHRAQEARTGKGPRWEAHNRHAKNYRRWLTTRIAALEDLINRSGDKHHRSKRIKLLKRVLAAKGGNL
jgi:lysozyme